MSNPIPDLLALTSIADGSQRLAAPIRNNYSAVQTAVNELIAALSGGSAGQMLQAADATHVQWATAGALYRKTTAKQVVSSVAETDLLNGEITVAANAIGPSGVLRLSARGDWKNASGGSAAPPRFKIKLGATTLLDTNALGADAASSAGRYPWRIDVLLANLGLTNSQWVSIDGVLYMAGNNNVYDAQSFVTGEGAIIEQATTVSVTMAPFEGGNATAVDTTASQALVLSVINGANSAAYDVTLKHALVEVL